jgi:predicted RNase H-like HicB family nuclease
MEKRKRIENLVSEKSGLTLNIVFRRYDDGSLVAECLEIPGCLSQGNTEEEAKANISDAINACLSVILEDAIKASCALKNTNLVGIEKQETVEISAPYILQPCA